MSRSFANLPTEADGEGNLIEPTETSRTARTNKHGENFSEPPEAFRHTTGLPRSGENFSEPPEAFRRTHVVGDHQNQSTYGNPSHPWEVQTIKEAWDKNPPQSRGSQQAYEGGLPPAEESYHWTYQENGTARYERNMIYKSNGEQWPQRFYDNTKGKFVNVEGEVKQRAVLGKVEIKYIHELTPEQQKEMEEIFQYRYQAIEKRDRLESRSSIGKELTEQQVGDLTDARYEVNEASRQLGEKAAEYYAREIRGLKAEDRVYPSGEDHLVSRTGEFDQVWKSRENGQEKFLVIEAKGGRGELGIRKVNNEYVEQGTKPYYNDITLKMTGSSNKHTAEIGEKLIIAKDEGRVEYIKVQATIFRRQGKDELGDIKITPFII